MTHEPRSAEQLVSEFVRALRAKAGLYPGGFPARFFAQQVRKEEKRASSALAERIAAPAPDAPTPSTSQRFQLLAGRPDAPIQFFSSPEDCSAKNLQLFEKIVEAGLGRPLSEVVLLAAEAKTQVALRPQAEAVPQAAAKTANQAQAPSCELGSLNARPSARIYFGSSMQNMGLFGHGLGGSKEIFAPTLSDIARIPEKKREFWRMLQRAALVST